MEHFYIAATLFGLGLACFASFSWGVKGHFRSTGKMPTGMKLVSLLSLLGFLSFTGRLITSGASGSAILALSFFVASLALFAWTIRATRQTPPTLAFDTDKPAFLLLHGPYQYVRHPFYLSYMLFWIGTAVAFAGALPWLTPLVMLLVYQQAASREERKFANSDFSIAYADYQRRAGMFVPRANAILHG
jgi:protein-S-isoprenylcysteine O-methyltransferase Ste14